MGPSLSSDLDSGSIVFIDHAASGRVLPRSVIELALRSDNAASFRHWFCFRAQFDVQRQQSYRIQNASQGAYPNAWKGYRVVASYDGFRWFRVPTTYDGTSLTFSHMPQCGAVTYACFAVYAYSRVDRLLAAARSAGAIVSVLGRTVQGRPISSVTFGSDAARYRVWIIARQHPGETMASWCAEGMIRALMDTGDAAATALLELAQLRIVPVMNPDGGILGNHRTNPAGVDLNRSWNFTDSDTPPEVLAVRSAILRSEVDLFLDLHGDEEIPHVFAAGCEGNPGYTQTLERLEDFFLNAASVRSPHFRQERVYPLEAPGTADLSLAANWVAETFGCLALTVEMPFKDDSRHPCESDGWSPQRSMRLGRDLLAAVLDTLLYLK